jgi:hypothetical protein
VPAVTSSKELDYAREDLDIFDFSLSPAEMVELSAL